MQKFLVVNDEREVVYGSETIHDAETFAGLNGGTVYSVNRDKGTAADDLDLTETEDLVEALRRRLGDRGALLFVTLRDISSGAEAAQVWYRGGRVTAKGLAWEALENLAKPANFKSEGTQKEFDDK